LRFQTSGKKKIHIVRDYSAITNPALGGIASFKKGRGGRLLKWGKGNLVRELTQAKSHARVNVGRKGFGKKVLSKERGLWGKELWGVTL